MLESAQQMADIPYGDYFHVQVCFVGQWVRVEFLMKVTCVVVVFMVHYNHVRKSRFDGMFKNWLAEVQQDALPAFRFMSPFPRRLYGKVRDVS